MRAKTFLLGAEATFLGLALLVFTPSINPTPIAAGVSSSQLETSLQNAPFESRVSSVPKGQEKPLAVWQCVTGWYGLPFDGQTTANGETYDMFATTAAHPTLPLGSIVRVVNPRNHRSQVVRINDRGPYVAGRELDVSYEVARRLGFDERGLAKVRLELLEVPSRPASDHHN
jgi:rare lipoprotein A (peptidoglycan hydrolase)